MTEKTRVAEQFGRFAPLLDPACQSRKIYDTVLFEVGDCVVAPTLGSIIPNWLLIVPTRPAMNFAQWYRGTGVNPQELIQEVSSTLRVELERIIWFEHGPSAVGSITGCGVDHAHIHVLVDPPFSFQAFDAAVRAESDRWKPFNTSCVYDHILGNESYMIIGSDKRAIAGTSVEELGSQYFRRTIAGLVQKPHAWNYRTHAHIGNVRRTVKTLAQQIGS
ncbi:hypothetical protein EPK99_08190 [Neorhizobium lilium]|uniref:HIT domain-containing protein n=1 Tax=Neorhizobium lilium TaxID=2503024 RepID=A0A3S3VNS9_9HYPH|nr:hypothetical protein [Neorhizobium lilium]RWX78575.1 hypothetical protein EPK99_08190 [Neorhizobium lilium]